MKKDMNEHLDLDDKKVEKITSILIEYLKGETSREEAKEKINDSFEQITAQEFALCEQYIGNSKVVDDHELTLRIEEVISIVKDVLVSNSLNLEEGHPIDTYLKEVEEIRNVLEEIKAMKNEKFIKNRWLEIYDKLVEIKTHFARKQNQLFPALEKKGFDKPSKIMWTLDDKVEATIKTALTYLKEDKEEEFLNMQEEVIDIVEDMMQKEEQILYPTSIDMISDEEFIEMRRGDDEIGYCLIDTPPLYGSEEKSQDMPNKYLLKDLKELLVKHGALDNLDSERELDVSQGKLTLEQINLIFKHLQVDLSYVDENDIAKFYSDTKHRIFPRSPGVIGREVRNCHPKESVDMVEEIIRAFRSGEQDEAEFWIDMGEKFIYIIYNAVRDEEGRFRGVLEMMQDVTRIRKLEGSQRLISWEENKTKKIEEEKSNKYQIDSQTLIGDLVKEYPYIKEFLVNLSAKYEKLKNPILFKTMSKMATLEMISAKGNFKTQELIDKIVARIDEENKK